MTKTPVVQALRERLEKGGVLSSQRVHPAALPFLAVLIRRLLPDLTIVVVASDLKSQETLEQDILTWLSFGDPPSAPETPQQGTAKSKAFAQLDKPLFYPSWEFLPHEDKLPHADVVSDRLATLVALSQKNGKAPGSKEDSESSSGSSIVITSITALLQRTFPPGMIEARTRVLRQGDTLEPLDLIEWLEDQFYEPEVRVTQKGEISLRGGIVDVFPLTSPWPVRLEFFGNELESLRYFDPNTQISRESISEAVIPPAGELGILKKDLLGGKASSTSPISSVDAEIIIPDRLKPGLHTQPILSTLIDYLPQKTLFLLCGVDELEEQARMYRDQIPAGDPFFISWESVMGEIAARGMTLLGLDSGELSELPPDPSIAESSPSDSPLPRLQSLDPFRPAVSRAPDPVVAEAQRREFFAQMHRWTRQGFAVNVFCNNDGERRRFLEIWGEYGFDKTDPPHPNPLPQGGEGEESAPKLRRNTLSMRLGTLSCGFLFEEGKLVVVTDAEIFGRYKVQRPRRLKSPHASAVRSALDIDFSEFEEGDYVVHLQYGIGRFWGLKILPAISSHKIQEQQVTPDSGEECLVIEYAPNMAGQPAPKLYVPVSEAHLVSKYVGAGKARPPLNTLGGNRWAKAKAHAENAIMDLAAELLSIQAARDTQPGHAFPSDTPWQREFEGSFLYEETPDQLRAISETKTDLESAKPMDRLICGDVGFGKTEVAIRAAFKAAMGGKQTAILVPTTVLAQQHYNTFRERMADYPIRVELLSRFRSRRELTKVIQDLATGGIDIVIGTHRLVQSDVVFKDLGLVVIDEEQRFGVAHKEKFKRLRRLVDVLTLSATPIPRTLYLALTGARDMSTIETPPQDRLPVETIVASYDERVIRDAIQRELNRGGQVFFLHNRVHDIDAVAARLTALVPRARIVVGHGQMGSDQLEEVMTQFVNGEADVLLSTTIIESGIDIPNANTIIIDRADRFGLSDLYQLRGRVGRYKHQAYAYLLIPRHASLLSDARKRITAIRQYSSLGSGFKIAMRDLEIRGAGNLLGEQQSGHITAVGFELYCQLLKQSVGVLKGEKVKPRVEVRLRLDFLALNPAEESQFREPPSRKKKEEPEHDPWAGIESTVPREVATYIEEEEAKPTRKKSQVELGRTPAYIPLSYIADSHQRVEAYRKIAQITAKAELTPLQSELRDRFGPMPPAMELLLQLTQLKLLAAEKNVTCIETREDRLMLTRNNDYLMLGGKFPRLTKTTAKARLNEVRRVLLEM